MADYDDVIDIDPETGEVIASSAGGGVASGGAVPPTHTIDESPPPTPDNDALPILADPHTYRPQLVLNPDTARELVQDLKTLQQSVLVPKVDFDQIPGTRGSPVLLKPGAERLLQVFGLGHELHRGEVDEDPEGGHWGVWYKCTVSKAMADGRVITISSCEGYASYDEDKFWDAKWEGERGNRRKVGMKKSPWNTVIKMAQKRAMVGATLTATATSGLFTQDMEDYHHEHPRAAPRGSQEEPGDPGAVSDAQVKLIQVLFGKLGLGHDREARLAKTVEIIGREIASTKDVTRSEATKLIDALKAEAGE